MKHASTYLQAEERGNQAQVQVAGNVHFENGRTTWAMSMIGEM